jgi:3-oxoacyl-[acyl-carrier-protein] synthase III
MNCDLVGIAYYLPERVVTNVDLAAQNPGWDADKIFKKTGIRQRHVVSEGETAADLGVRAAERLFDQSGFDRRSVDTLIVCTQSPDHFLPGDSSLIQERLGLPTTCAAFDVTLGCSGYTYGLWLARALITSGSSQNALLISTDTYSRYCDLHDTATVTLFGDAAGATLLTGDPQKARAEIGLTVLGTDGRGACNLIVRDGAARSPSRPDAPPRLYMNGPEIVSFTLNSVKAGIDRLLNATGLGWDQVDLFLMHQANRFLLDSLRLKMGVDPERLPIDVEQTGNTVNASIPLLISRLIERGQLRGRKTSVLAGFGVGYSWAMSLVKWL